jgi:hypothetical protein
MMMDDAPQRFGRRRCDEWIVELCSLRRMYGIKAGPKTSRVLKDSRVDKNHPVPESTDGKSGS